MIEVSAQKRRRNFIGLSSDFRRTLAAILFGLCATGPAMADGGDDLIGAMAGICITSLETGATVGPGLARADAAMETKLLRDKDGKIWRTWTNQVVILAHNSGQTCEVMGLGIAPSVFETAMNAWLANSGQSYTANKPASFPVGANGGMYLATRLEDGDFIQIFVTSLAEARYIEIIAARVANSVEARDLLGIGE